MSDTEEEQVIKVPTKKGRPKKDLAAALPPDSDAEVEDRESVEKSDEPPSTSASIEDLPAEAKKPKGKASEKKLAALAKARVERLNQLKGYKADVKKRALADAEEFFRKEIDKEVQKVLAAERKSLEEQKQELNKALKQQMKKIAKPTKAPVAKPQPSTTKAKSSNAPKKPQAPRPRRESAPAYVDDFSDFL